ncbi:3122_t:CDS:2 [Diversispora eburnea]|uniref:3122_t:CDS:1 n=1 Tax=Diversispora eburnea TaxID=1213867 RepID=A0A9N9BSJ9_9GLOM|nr:3122_t:CDS:2 [Diversispora eburnea]
MVVNQGQKFPQTNETNNNLKTQEYRKGRFTEEEDQDLIKFYNMYIEDQRNKILAVMEPHLNRNSKSLRERYCNHLDPNVDHSELTKEEKLKIKFIYESLRTTSFSEIARILNQSNVERNEKRRTDFLIRNYLSPRLRKEKRIKDRMSITNILNN